MAEALASIVEKRAASSKNFQLVVITHDEDFISMLGNKVADAQHYYRISRNERGLSKINKMRLDEMG